MTLESLFKVYNYFFKTFRYEFLCNNYELTNLKKSRIFKEFMMWIFTMLIQYSPPITKYIVRVMTLLNFKTWWIMWMFIFRDFVYAPFWFQFVVTTLFLGLCKLTSLQIHICDINLIPSFFFKAKEHTLGLHFTTKPKVD
jgi:hypothetical protein